MTRMWWVVATLAVCLVGGGARAGVYNLDDPRPLYPPLGVDYKGIRLVLDPLRVASVPLFPDQSPDGYKRHAAELEAKPAAERTTSDRVKLGACYLRLGRPGDAVRRRGADRDNFLVRTYLQTAELEGRPPADRTTADKINLGACYIRLGRTNDAVAVLGEADQAGPGNFLVLANLAAAYQALNEPERAVAYQGQALAAWPSVQPGWNQGELAWFRRVEGFQRKLLQSRLRESSANPAAKRWDAIDPLFDKPSPSKDMEYEAQIEPWKLWGDLPPDAYAVVGQMLLWSPNDDRLYWQLGELLNALGNVQEAADVLDELVNSRNESTVRELMRHRRVLMDALAAANAVNGQIRTDPVGFQTDYHTLIWAVTPRGLLLAPPGLGDAANEVVMAARAQVYSTPPAPAAPAPQRPQAGWWSWQPIFVGFTAGAILATLAALQWNEWRRRHRAAAFLPSQRTEPAVHDAGAFRSDAPSAADRLEGTP